MMRKILRHSKRRRASDTPGPKRSEMHSIGEAKRMGPSRMPGRTMSGNVRVSKGPVERKCARVARGRRSGNIKASKAPATKLSENAASEGPVNLQYRR